MKKVGLGKLLVSTLCCISINAVANDWDGQYFGITLGATNGFVKQTSSLANTSGAYFTGTDFTQVPEYASKSIDVNKIDIALTYSINKEVHSLVYGLDADLIIDPNTRAKESGNISYTSLPAQNFNVKSSIKNPITIGLRPKIGFVQGNTLVYAAAGVAVSQIDYRISLVDTYNTVSYQQKNKVIKLGYSFGLGLDYKLKNNLLIKAEYLFTQYSDLDAGRTDIYYSAGPDYWSVINNNGDYRKNSIRIGLLKKF